MAERQVHHPFLGPITEVTTAKQVHLKGVAFTETVVAAAGANPKGPLGMPLYGPLAGPVGP